MERVKIFQIIHQQVLKIENISNGCFSLVVAIDCYSYACQLLSKMQDKINDLKEFLSEIPFPTDYSGKYYTMMITSRNELIHLDSMLGQIQRCSSSNEIQNFQQPLGIFVELVKLGFMDKESRDRTSRKSSVAGENIEKGIDGRCYPS